MIMLVIVIAYLICVGIDFFEKKGWFKGTFRYFKEYVAPEDKYDWNRWD